LTPARVVRALASAKIFVFCSAWLVALVIVGTLAQASIGLYQAQERYFSSWFLWLGPVPLPLGGRLTLTIVFVNLLAMFLRPETWRLDRIGLKVTHLGALLLLFGGFLTAYFSREGNMVIPEGETTDYVSSYRDLELAVIDSTDPAFDEVVAFPQGRLHRGRELADEAVPMEMEVLAFYRNCDTVRRSTPPDEDAREFARRFELKGVPPDTEDGNRGGLTVRVSGTGGDGDGIYTIVEFMSSPPVVATSQGPRTLILRRARNYLPFALELIDFEKQLHPGTQMARSYQSVVNVVEDGTKRRTVIRMNEPLRHRGYTFYQSSFMEGGGSETTVLAVVKNYGRVFPYVSSLVMCLGLLVHLVSMVPGLIASPARGGRR